MEEGVASCFTRQNKSAWFTPLLKLGLPRSLHAFDSLLGCRPQQLSVY